MGCEGHDCNHVDHSRGTPRNIRITFKSGVPHYASSHTAHQPSQFTASRLLSNKAKELWPSHVDTCEGDCKCQYDDSKPPASDITTPEDVVVDDYYVDDPGLGRGCYWKISGVVDLRTEKWPGTCIKDGTKKWLAFDERLTEGERLDRMGWPVEMIDEEMLAGKLEQYPVQQEAPEEEDGEDG